MSDETTVRSTGVLLAKIRSTDRLLAASSRGGLEPLRVTVTDSDRTALSLDGRARWFAVETEPDVSPWDQAHARVAAQLGVDETDVEFVEPDLQHSIFRDVDDDTPDDAFAVGAECDHISQDTERGKPEGPSFAWHLERGFTDLGRARDAVRFDEPRTRVAHIDTGYSDRHETRPAHINRILQRNFATADGRLTSAIDPDNDVPIMDNSGHGTGTLSILAGGAVASQGEGILGGAPDAEIVPIRVADRVVLIRTSALARGILYAADVQCAVASLSMGGLPSKAWAEAIDEAYEVGLCFVAAAGNRMGELPPRSLVYPARYPRVIAVTGAMADHKPYEDLEGTALEGCFGPKSAMGSAIAAYTPNIPWAKFGCPDTTRLNGEGTSAATPQIAAAAALWIEKYKDLLPSDWRRVEAVRHALFSKAKVRRRFDRFGNGILQAHAALAVRPNLHLSRSGRSKHRFAVFRMLTGLAVDRETATEEMFNLELAQLWLTEPALARLLDDPEGAETLPESSYREILDAVIDCPDASEALKNHLRSRYRQVTRQAPPPRPPTRGRRPTIPLELADPDEPPPPPHRRLRVYAKDPTLASTFATAAVGEVTLEVPWEPVPATATGFVGECLEVVDDLLKPGDGESAAELSLDHTSLLAQDGWAPSPGNLQFHQQMVYAVAMKTIQHFERALGRPVQWRPRMVPGDRRDDRNFVRRLTLRPHALEEANAFYSPKNSALLFGYFTPAEVAGQLPDYPVYSCLSHDIIAHEATHAIVDGLYRQFAEPTNPDVLAFHEGFSDIVALLQSFDLTELLEYEINSSRGDLQADTVLGKLALQFGGAARGREALRSAIGTTVDGEWQRSVPDPTALANRTTPHARGAILVSAVFDALIAIYEARTSDLFRIATGGTGRLPDGAIHPDLARRLASEAAKSARHLLRMCIRALDYLPPVDVTFFDFLRALVTADFEYVPDDRYNYRVAIVEAFTKRGIGPGENDASAEGVRSLSADALRWAGFKKQDAGRATAHYRAIVKALAEYAEACTYIQDRKELFHTTRSHRAKLNRMFKGAFEKSSSFRRSLGLDPGSFEVHALRRAMRARPNGRVEPEVIVSLLQRRDIGKGRVEGTPRHPRLGGVTMVVNLTDADLPRYRIVKDMNDDERHLSIARFAADNAADPLRTLYLAPNAEQFAALHHLAEG